MAIKENEKTHFPEVYSTCSIGNCGTLLARLNKYNNGMSK